MSTPITPSRPTLVLLVLFSGAFVMGCAEMLVIGMLDLIAADLDVPVSSVGALVTANALGIAVGGPLLAIATSRLDRRPVLLGAAAVFVAANLLPAAGADHSAFLAARVLIGAVQGLFIAAGIVTACAIVPPERAGRAMGVVISGFAVATAVGLPVGALLGRAVGWRGSFVAVVVLATVVLVAAAAVLPSVPSAQEGTTLGQARHAFSPAVLAVLGLGCLIFTAVHTAMTYVVPFLDGVTGASGATLALYLLVYGAATSVGSAAGGRFADAGSTQALVAGTTGGALFLAVMYVAGGSPVVVAVAILGIGLFEMGTAPSLQHRVATLAGPGESIASALPASAANAGIALGSVLGGASLDGWGARSVALTGAAIGLVAIALACATSRLRPASSSGAAEPGAATALPELKGAR